MSNYLKSDYKIDLAGGEDAVLLIHGLTGSPFEMKYLARKLNAAGFTVKGPCLAGHGRTLADLRKTRWQDWYQTAHETFNDLKRNYKSVSVSGLCMGTLLAICLAAEHGDEVSALSLLSTTFFYDGWSLPWYKFLLPISYYPPFRYIYSYKEREPYGIKNKSMRERIVESMKDNSIAYPSIPSESMHEFYKLARKVKSIMSRVETPALILHSLEDDMASIRNADFVENNIGSIDIRKVLIDDSYHMLTIDNQKHLVAQETVDFFKKYAGQKGL